MNDLVIAKKYINKAKNAAKAGHEFALSFGEYKKLAVRKTCAYSKIPFSPHPERWDSRTMDRIDNKVGYTAKNTVACCYGINQIKSMVENQRIPMDIGTLVKAAKSIELATNK